MATDGHQISELPVTRHIAILREHRFDLKERYKLDKIGVFGSWVRNEQHEQSDLDVLVSFSETPSLFTLVDLQDELTELLGIRVDLVVRSELRPRIGERIEHEVVEV